MVFALGRFWGSVVVGFAASPLFRGVTVALCESVAPPGKGSKAHISADGQTNHLFDNDPLPTKEELQYVKTWGVPWVEDWDLLATRSGVFQGSSSDQRQIIMIRHGQYMNEGKEGDNHHYLTPLGEQQARDTGKYLQQQFQQGGQLKQRRLLYQQALSELKTAKKNGATPEALEALRAKAEEAHTDLSVPRGIFIDDAPVAVHVSGMTRAKQTANLILEAFPASVRRRLDVDPELRERIPCAVQPARRFSASAEDMRVAEAVFERYFHRPIKPGVSVEVIVGHGNMIRYLTMRALQLPPEAWLRTSLPHCSVTTINIRGNGHVSLVGMGSYGHLSPDKVTVSNMK